jgi:arylsulfatase A
MTWSASGLAGRLAGGVLALFFFAAHGTESSKPNIVFILADDLGWGELGCYGQQKIRTPNIDRLAAEGMRFTQHYSGAPVCAPARNVLMTGLHLGHAEIRGNKQAVPGGEGQWPISENTFTIAKALKQAGYATGAVGKWGLGPVGSSGDPNKQGFDLFFGYNCQAAAHTFFPPHLWRNDEKITINTKPVPRRARQPDGEVKLEDWQSQTYAPDLIQAEAVKFIEQNAGKPFFLYCAFIEPHVAIQPPKRLVDSYPREWDDRPYRGENGYLPHPRPRAGYAAMITGLDEHVGKLIEVLDKHNLRDKTIVIFTSDNGTTHKGRTPPFGVGGVDADFFDSTRGLRGFKGSVYEGGLRVPLIVRWPGKIEPGTTSDFASYFPDHFPTLCDVAGLTPPRGLDGVSLWPMLAGKAKPERNPMVWVFAEYGGQVAVRIGNFKVLRNDLNTENPGEWEVYNVANDPGERRNVAAKRPGMIRKAVQILQRETSDNPVFPVKLPPADS